MNSQEKELARDTRRAHRREERETPRHEEYRCQHLPTQELEEEVAWTNQEFGVKTSVAFDKQRRGFLSEAAYEVNVQENKAANTANAS